MLKRRLNPKDATQNQNVLYVRENIVTEAVSAKKQNKDSTISNSSDIRAKRILTTAAKKVNLSILQPFSTSIPYNCNMSGFDAKLEYMVTILLDGPGASNLIQLMFVFYNIETFKEFYKLTKDCIDSL